MASRELRVAVVGDARDLQRALRGADRDLNRFGRSAATIHGRVGTGFLRMGQSSRVALSGIGTAAFAAGGAMALFGKKSFDAYQESARVGRQTNAVLKSTSGEANISAREVTRLATALSRKSGIDDEAIQSGENMLLTFRNIRNEAGKGNDIFTQTTRATVDLAAAFTNMGKDMSVAQAGLQIGKALNDPIKGMSRLQRIGVTFTDQQKAQVKVLENSGRHLDAQKVILRELNKEFGGSAAAGRTATKSLKVSFENLQESIGRGLAPAVNSVAAGLQGEIDKAQPIINRFSRDVARIFDRKDLSLGEKFRRSFRVGRRDLAPIGREISDTLRKVDIGKQLGRAIEVGLPVVADSAAKAGPKAAVAFVKGFRAAGIWGELLTVGFLAKRFGVFGKLGGLAAGAFGRGLGRGGGGAVGGLGVQKVFVVNEGFGGGPDGGGGKRGIFGRAASYAKYAAPAVAATAPIVAGAALPAAAAFAFGQRSKVNDLSVGDLTKRLREPTKAARALRQGLEQIAKMNVVPSSLRNFQRTARQALVAIGSHALDTRRALSKIADTPGVQRDFRAMSRIAGRSLDDIRRTTDRTTRDLRTRLGSDTTAGRIALARNFDLSRDAIVKSMATGKVSVRDGMRFLKTRMNTESRDGRTGLQQNMRGVVRALSKAMDDSKGATRAGLGDIRDQFTRELKEYGIGGGNPFSGYRGRGNRSGRGGNPVKARGGRLAGGGWIGRRGERGVDNVHFPELGIVAARGEALLDTPRGPAVVNRHQADPIEEGLALRSMVKGGPANLDQVFATYNRPHYMAEGGRVKGYARGGMVRVPGDPNTTGGRDRVNAAIAGQVASWIRRYHINIGYGYDPGGGHKSPGHNVTGTALDVVPAPGGSWDTVEAGLRAAVRAGKTVYYGTHGIGTPLANHGRGNHGHVEWGLGGKVGGSVAGSIAGLLNVPKIRGARWRGPGGNLSRLGQRGLDVTRRAANRKLGRLVDAAGVATAGESADLGRVGVFKGGGQSAVARALLQTAKRMHAPAQAVLALFEAAIVESGLRNLSYGDRDSVGVLQQRPSQGWGSVAQIRNPNYAAAQFLRRAIPRSGRARSAGQLAQSVQVSAFSGRYNQHRREAIGWIHRLGGYGGVTRARGGRVNPAGRIGMPVGFAKSKRGKAYRKWIHDPETLRGLGKIRGMMGEAWRAVRPHLPAGARMPRTTITTGEDSIFVGVDAEAKIGHREFFLPDWVAASMVGGPFMSARSPEDYGPRRNAGKRLSMAAHLLPHEWAHAYQNFRLGQLRKEWEVEGSASLFGDAMGPRVFQAWRKRGGAFGRSLGYDVAGKGDLYTGYGVKVAKQHRGNLSDWIMRGQFARRARGGRVGRQDQSLINKVWRAADPFLPGSYRPFLRVGGTAQGRAGQWTPFRSDTMPGGWVGITPDVLRGLRGEGMPRSGYNRDQGRTAAVATLIHEWAHSLQSGETLSAGKRVVEGGAEAFTRMFDNRVMSRLGWKFGSTPGWAGDYNPYVRWVQKNKGRKWITAGQFRPGGRWARAGRGGRVGMAGGGRVAYVGDSLGVGTVPKLRRIFKHPVVPNVVGGRSSAAGVAALRGILRAGRGRFEEIVLDLGTNDTSAGQLKSSIRRAVGLAHGIPLFVPTVRGPHANEKNDMLRTLARRRVITLIPWAGHSGRYVGSDGIHASPAGYAARASMIRAAFRQGGTTSPGGAAPDFRRDKRHLQVGLDAVSSKRDVLTDFSPANLRIGAGGQAEAATAAAGLTPGFGDDLSAASQTLDASEGRVSGDDRRIARIAAQLRKPLRPAARRRLVAEYRAAGASKTADVTQVGSDRSALESLATDHPAEAQSLVSGEGAALLQSTQTVAQTEALIRTLRGRILNPRTSQWMRVRASKQLRAARQRLALQKAAQKSDKQRYGRDKGLVDRAKFIAAASGQSDNADDYGPDAVYARDIARAESTPGTADDRFVQTAQVGRRQRELSFIQGAHGSPASEAQAYQNLKDAKDALQSLEDVVSGSDLAGEVKALRMEMESTRKVAEGRGSVFAAEALRALADYSSGQMFGLTQSRAVGSAGAGSVMRS